ncbi:MAG TPA: MFS transporter [Burkholderiales bacterium]
MTAPTSFPALRHPGFRAYFLVSALAMMADSVEHVISYWIMFQKFHSPALGGFAMLSHWLPFLFFSVYAGALADRFDPRRLIQAGMGLFMLASLSWGALFLTDSLQAWHAAVLLVIHGFAGVLWAPASQLLIHDIVGEKDLHSAIRLNATARFLGLLAGPAVGAGVMIAFGPSWGILVNVLFYVPLVAWCWKAKVRREKRVMRPLRGLADIFQTMKDVAGNPIVMAMCLLSAGAGVFIGTGYQAQMPEFAHDLGHGEPGAAYSALLAADAAGALTAGLVLEARGLLKADPKSALFLAMLWACALVGFAASRSYELALALLFVAGFLELAFNAMAQTLVQIHAPAAVRGRVIGLYSMASLGMRAFSGVTIGFAGSLVGVHWSLGASATALLLFALWLWTFADRPNHG